MAMFKTVEPSELTLSVASGDPQRVKELVKKGKLVTEVEEVADDDCIVFDSNGAGDASSRRQRCIQVDINGKIFIICILSLGQGKVFCMCRSLLQIPTDRDPPPQQR